jgi:hypothetical protein
MLRKHYAAVFLWSLSSLAMALDCDAIDKEAQASPRRALIPESQAVMVTVGNGRVQFYGAPDERCIRKAIFVLPSERLNAYADYGDFTYVLYQNPRNANEVTGWVRSSRLKWTGYGNGAN